MKTKSRIKGFTLMELIITIAVLAIILAMGIPSFVETIRLKRIKEPAEKIYADLQWLKMESIKANRKGLIFIKIKDDGGWCYRFFTESTSNDDDDDYNCVTTSEGSKEAIGNNDYFNKNIELLEAEENKLDPIADSNEVKYYFDPIRGLVYENDLKSDSSITLPNGDVEITFQYKEKPELKIKVAITRLGHLKICAPDGKIGDYPKCQP